MLTVASLPYHRFGFDQRFISFLKDDRTAASDVLTGPTEVPQVDREQLLKVSSSRSRFSNVSTDLQLTLLAHAHTHTLT